MTKILKSLVPALLLIFPALLFAENVRGPVVANLSIDSTSKPQEETLGIEDLLGVELAGNGRFVKGIELDFTLPASARQYRNLLGLYIYKGVKPRPSKASDLYSGDRAGFIVLPATSRVYVNVPIKPNSIQQSAETITIGTAIPATEFPLIVTILPVAKGLPTGVSESQFGVKVSPILEDKGLLKLDISESGKPPEFPFSLSIDDQSTEPQSGGYELASGIHHLSITSDHYKEINKTFGIDKGQTTSIAISLERLVPKITFEAPDSAEIFLDGQKLDGVPTKPVTVTEGEHTVIMRVGNYSLTKKFSVERGRSYKISLFLDISVQEN